MDRIVVDEAIERYVNERMTRGKKEAAAHFLSYAYLRYTGGELEQFLKKTAKISQYYMKLFRVMVNPLKGPEGALFASFVTIGIYSCFLMTSADGERTLGILLFSGALVNGWSIIRNAIRKWCDLDVLIAIYRELAQLAEKAAASA